MKIHRIGSVSVGFVVGVCCWAGWANCRGSLGMFIGTAPGAEKFRSLFGELA